MRGRLVYAPARFKSKNKKKTRTVGRGETRKNQKVELTQSEFFGYNASGWHARKKGFIGGAGWRERGREDPDDLDRVGRYEVLLALNYIALSVQLRVGRSVLDIGSLEAFPEQCSSLRV